MGWMECCTTSFFNCCLASNINLVLLGTYIIAKDPYFDPFCVWGNEIFMNQHQVRKLIKIVIKMGQKMSIELFVYALCKTTVNCRMVSVGVQKKGYTFCTPMTVHRQSEPRAPPHRARQGGRTTPRPRPQ